MISTNPFLPIILLRVTPSANRNTYSVATLIIYIPRVEALHASTLGYEIATPSELPGMRTVPLWATYIMPLGACHTPNTTFISPLTTCHTPYTTHIFPMATCHSPHTTHIFQLATCHSPHTTHIFPLASCHSPYTTHIFPLGTYHTPHTTHIMPWPRAIHTT